MNTNDEQPVCSICERPILGEIETANNKPVHAGHCEASGLKAELCELQMQNQLLYRTATALQLLLLYDYYSRGSESPEWRAAWANAEQLLGGELYSIVRAEHALKELDTPNVTAPPSSARP